MEKLQTLEWCPRCDGEGVVPVHNAIGKAKGVKKVCPACKGSRLVIVDHG